MALTKSVEYCTPQSGRMYKENDKIVNMVDYQVVAGTTISVDQTNTWAASDIVNLTKANMWTQPSIVKPKYEFIVSNPSMVTDLTWTVNNLETGWNGETRRAKLATATIPKSTAAVIEDCEDAWSEQVITGVTASVDSTNKVVGTNSALFTIHSTVTTSILASEVMSATNMSIYTHVNFWLRSSIDVTQSGILQLLLDNTALCASPTETLDIPAFTSVSGGQWVTLPLANPANDSAIISIGVKQNKVTGLGAWTLNIDNVKGLNMSTVTNIVEGAFVAGDVVETKSNDTALGANDAFQSITRVREV